ncbi:MAG: hypothetical protein GY821_18160 [Gammaproteobacteria bacterium]|nr:hypothetical protein [Gammaproteobacteria bacterium]
MSRKAKLIQQSDQLIRRIRHGGVKGRETRKRELRRLVNDLIYLGIAPRSLHKISEKEVFIVVEYWKKKKLSPRAVANKLGIIRTFFRLAFPDVVIPDNKLLNLRLTHESRQLCKPHSIDKVIHQVEHSLTRSILEFQVYFGLTKLESIRININYALYERALIIDRALTSNGKDRSIPILTPEQKRALSTRKGLLGIKERLTDIVSEPILAALYKADCLIKGLEPNFPYRKHYAEIRYKHLLETIGTHSAIRQLQSELGVSSKYRMMELL